MSSETLLTEALTYLERDQTLSSSDANDCESSLNNALEKVGSQARLLYQGDSRLARVQLAQQFREVLNDVASFAEFEQQVGELTGYLGHSGYAFMVWQTDEEGGREFPKQLLGSCLPEVFQFSAGLLQSAVAGTQNRSIAEIFHHVECGSYEEGPGLALVDNWLKQESYVLVTNVGNYGFVIPNSGNQAGRHMALAVVSEGMNADDFRYHLETNRVALNLLAGAIDAVGLRRFMDIFKDGDGH